MTDQTPQVLSEAEYAERFKQAVAFYDHYLQANTEKRPEYELAAKAIKKAELPIVGEEKAFTETIISYHSSDSVFARNLLRYIWATYNEA